MGTRTRGSVREAMKIFSAFGLIDIRVGNGTYICESIGNGIMDSFLFSFFLSNPDVANLYELRQLFEIDIMKSSIITTHKNQRGEVVLKIHKDIMDVIENRKTDQITSVIENSVNTWSILQTNTESLSQ